MYLRRLITVPVNSTHLFGASRYNDPGMGNQRLRTTLSPVYVNLIRAH